MLLNNQPDDVTPFNTLPPRVSRNETFTSDAVSSRLSMFHKSAEKKREIPRYPGGIWDYEMDVDEIETRKAVLRDKASFRHLLNKMSGFENIPINDTSEKCDGGVLESEVAMDTRETKNNESAAVKKLALEIEKVIYDNKDAFDEIKNFIISESPSEKLKKKNSDEGSSLERSKRCRTSSSTEVYPFLSTSTNELGNEKDMSAKAVHMEMVDDLKISHGVKLEKGKMAKLPVKELYQKVIDTLQQISSVFESLNAAGQNVNRKSYSVEVEHLLSICNMLKSLENNNHASKDVNPEILRENVNVPANRSAKKEISTGEAVSFLDDIKSKQKETIHINVRNSIRGTSKYSKFDAEFQNAKQGASLTKDHSLNKTVPLWRRKSIDFSDVNSKKSELSVCNQDEHSIISDRRLLRAEDGSKSVAHENTVIEKILNGTLPWRATGSPPPAVAFSGVSAKVTKDSEVSRMVHVPILPSTVVAPKIQAENPAASQSRAMDTASPTRAIGAMSSKAMSVVFPSRAMDVSCSSRAMDFTSPSRIASILKDKAITSSLEASATEPTAVLNPIDATLSSKAMDVESSTKTIERSLPSTLIKTSAPNEASKEQKSKEHSPFSLKDNEVTKSIEAKPFTAPPKNYIPPHLRKCNSGDQGGNGYKEPSELRPILPWRDNTVSQIKVSEALKKKSREALQNLIKFNEEQRADAALSWRVQDGPTISCDSNKNNDNWQHFRNKNKPPTQSEPIRKTDSSTVSNPGSSLSLEVKKTYSGECCERRSQQEEKVLNSDVKIDKLASGSKPSEITGDLNAMISLKIFGEKNSLVDELMVPCNELIRVKRKFPNLFQVVPSADEDNKILEWNAEAVRVFLRCVFSISYTLPGWEITLEAFALAKIFQIESLQAACKDFFNHKPISAGHVQCIVQLARKLRITDVLKTSLMFAEVQTVNIPESAIQVTSHKPRCSVSCITSVEPSEFYIPLYYMKERGLASTKKSDVENNINFEALTGRFTITGFQIKLEAESRDLGKELNIFCDVFKNQERVFGEERQRPLRNMMIINFTQKLVVKPKEDVMIKVVIEDLCLRLCHCLKKDKELGRCSTGSFQTTFISDKKTEAKQALFFVEKLFYIYEGQKN